MISIIATEVGGVLRPADPPPMGYIFTAFDGENYNYYYEGDTLPATPESEPEADWQGLLSALDAPERGGNGLFEVMLRLSRPDAWQAYNMVRGFLQSPPAPMDLLTLGYLYSGFLLSLTESQQGALRQAIASNRIPLELLPP